MLLDTRSGGVLAVLAGHGGPVNAVAYSPDGATLAICGSDPAVSLYDVASATRREGTGLAKGRMRIRSLALMPPAAKFAMTVSTSAVSCST